MVRYVGFRSEASRAGSPEIILRKLGAVSNFIQTRTRDRFSLTNAGRFTGIIVSDGKGKTAISKMTTRQLYSFPDGKPTYYVNDDTLYENGSGKHVFYIREDAVYSYSEGKATYYIRDNYLYEYSSGQAKFYFGE